MEPPVLKLGGKYYVVVERAAYERICRLAGLAEETPELPSFPLPDKNGNYPAIEYARASIARDIILDRRRCGLSQQALARLAGVRQETLSRLETGKHTATVRVVAKIDRALKKATRQHYRPS